MKIKNISLRTYQHDIYTIKPGTEISVPDNIGKMLLRTKEFILLEEIKDVQDLGPKPNISEVKLEGPKKSGYIRKGNRKRI